MITPIDTRILVTIPQVERVTPGGIILIDDGRDMAQMAQVRAEVVAIGEWAFPDIRYAPEVGDTVYISKYAGLIYTVDDVEYRVLDTASGASDIVAYESELPSQDLRNLRREEEKKEQDDE